MYQGLVQVPSDARTADMIVRIDISSDEYDVIPFEKKGISIGFDMSDLSTIQL